VPLGVPLVRRSPLGTQRVGCLLAPPIGSVTCAAVSASGPLFVAVTVIAEVAPTRIDPGEGGEVHARRQRDCGATSSETGSATVPRDSGLGF